MLDIVYQKCGIGSEIISECFEYLKLCKYRRLGLQLIKVICKAKHFGQKIEKFICTY